MTGILGELGLTALATSITGLSPVGAAAILADSPPPAALVKHPARPTGRDCPGRSPSGPGSPGRNGPGRGWQTGALTPRGFRGGAGCRSRGVSPAGAGQLQGPMRSSWRCCLNTDHGHRARNRAGLERARQRDLDSVHGGAGPHVARDPRVEGVDIRVLGLELWPAALRGEGNAAGKIL